MYDVMGWVSPAEKTMLTKSFLKFNAFTQYLNGKISDPVSRVHQVSFLSPDFSSFISVEIQRKIDSSFTLSHKRYNHLEISFEM